METNIPGNEKMSAHLQKVILYATDEAQKNGSEFVDTEHLLLGLLEVSDEVLKNIFARLELNLENLKEFTRYNLGGSKTKGKKEPVLSPRTKRVLEVAEGERQELHHHYLSSEHVLLAMIKEESGEGGQILKKFNITYDRVKEAIVKTVGVGKEDVETAKLATPYLDKFGQDLLEEARSGKLDPVIGRGEEIERTLHILARRKKNNPVLVGEAGVGKTAIVEGLAYRLLTGDIPETMKGKRIYSVSINALMAGASKRGEFEERLEKIIKEAKNSNGEIILFFDEIHTLISGSGDTDTANILKPSLARGDMQLIGATTPEEYRLITKDAALERRLSPVRVPEPSEEETLEIMLGIRDKYEAFHQVALKDEVLKAAIRLSVKYIYDRYLPDKALDLLDEAAARVRIPALAVPEKIKTLEKNLVGLDKEIEDAQRNHADEQLVELTKKKNELKAKLTDLQAAVTEEQAHAHHEVKVEDLERVVAEWTGIPLQHLRGSEQERLMHMADYLHESVIGQNSAVNIVSAAVKRGRAGLKKSNRPIGSFIFLGTTGVGKTELAKALARYLFGKEEAMIRFDMSEFMEKHAVFRLLGAPPGYVGYEEGGQLTEAVRKEPYSIVLFDEVEKADKEVFDILLQILDDGRLTDNRGKVVNFKNTIIICTSNLGSDIIADRMANWQDDSEEVTMSSTAAPILDPSHELAAGPEDKTVKEPPKTERVNKNNEAILVNLKAELTELLKKQFRPELINRFDDVVVFEQLSREHMAKIVTLMMKETWDNLAEQNITGEVTTAAARELARLGYDPAFGARPLKRVIQEKIDNLLADAIIAGEVKAGQHVTIDFVDGNFLLHLAMTSHSVSTQEAKTSEQGTTSSASDERLSAETNS